MKLIKSLVIFTALLAATHALADKTAFIYGFAHDRITHENLINTQVSLMKGDSIISVTATNSNFSVGSKGGAWFFIIPVDGTTDYTIILERDGYTVMSWPLKAQFDKKPLKVGEYRFIEDIPLDKAPKVHEIDGVTIRATKVKFYHRGDTLVYDADAFQTAEGSMLDALIRQLPGAELTDQGEIFVNGRKVESLLLNGEKFFDNNRQIMLENLPAYMVKTVKTYEKAGLLSQLNGRDMGDKEFVMDVGLKKQYQIGWIGNVEAGYGTEDRYLARLFAMRFGAKSRITLYGNLNNLNDNRKPGENTTWTPETMPTGLMATKTAGLDFLFKSKDEQSKYSGNVQFSNIDTDDRIETTGETFLADGNTFSRSLDLKKARDFSFTTEQELEVWNKRQTIVWRLEPKLTYLKTHSMSQNIAMAFNQNPAIKATSALIDSVYRGSNADLLATVINRNLNNTMLDGHKLDLNIQNINLFKLDGIHGLTVAQEISYSDNAQDSWQQQQIDYPNNDRLQPLYNNRYTHNRPDRSFTFSNEVQMQRQINNLTAQLSYEYQYTRRRNDYNTYLLHRITGWDTPDDHPIGMLPSELECAEAIDRQNSYLQIERTVEHTPELKLVYRNLSQVQSDTAGNIKGSHMTFAILTLPVTFAHDRLDYTRAAYSGLTKRNNTFFNPSFWIGRNWANMTHGFYISYTLTHTPPSMIYALNILNDEDPLNIYYGNPHLRNTTTHNAVFHLMIDNEQKELRHGLSLTYNISHNAVAMGYVYDRTSGIRTYTPGNVNGNYTLQFDYDFHRAFGKLKKFSLDSKTGSRIVHGMDLVGTDTGAAPSLSSVMTYWTTEDLALSYKLGKESKVGVRGYVGYGHSASSRADFTSVNLWDFNYGLTSQLALPWHMQLVSDLTLYCHRGYANAGSNTNDLVWNARISKTIPKLGLTLALDGFDILGNLSNISQVLNSQGRTETYRNSLPRYVMLHAIYRLNIKPKKR